jgi:hypothetical protein
VAVDCPGYPCQPGALSPSCFIAAYTESGACDCLVPAAPGACGQPCSPDQLIECETGIFEYNGQGVCACGPAVCPCGQPCPPTSSATCQFIRYYNESGQCVCPPVHCPCKGPCCGKYCGEECALEGCDGGDDCKGYCTSAQKCTAAPQKCPREPG